MRTINELKNVRMGDMTRDESRLIVNAACGKLQKELTDNAPAIAEILSQPKRWTLAEIKAANERGGGYFFSRDTMRFFGDTMRSFAVRHIDGKVYIQRVRPARNAPPGFDQSPIKLSTELRLFDPETGDIGIPKAIDNE